MNMRYATDSAVIATPIGAIRITGDDTLNTINILTEPATPARATAPAVLAAAEQLEAWFAGALHAFDLALEPAGTPRGLVLRQRLIDVGYGETLSYGAFARKLGSSPRAIGQLCARNPFPIVVPCHRILASDGMGNYSAGAGVTTKQWLLDHEQRHRRDR
jgi:methylated-DNA-[protein]-cysteine S-methyltransferase